MARIDPIVLEAGHSNRMTLGSEKAPTKVHRISESRAAKPFLKWAGGKTQLLDQIERHLPEALKNGKIKRYFEPFVGSGAVFFHLSNKYSSTLTAATLCDVNIELILLYQVIQRNVEELIDHLEKEAGIYARLNQTDRRNRFEYVRSTFNREHRKINYSKYSLDWIPRAAQFVFLNKTCFNGLYRVNRDGEFNTPFGKYLSPRILDADNLRVVSTALSMAECRVSDYSSIRRNVTRESFVYFDPPYRPLTETASFTAYSKVQFGDDEQIRLAKFYRVLNEKGCKLMLSNSDPKNVSANDHFFDKWYEGFRIERVDASRMINSKACGRGKIKELLILNYGE